jgi:sulfonate transport system permease protein
MAAQMALRTLRTAVRPLAPWVLPLVVLIAWQLLCTYGGVPLQVLPAPSKVVQTAWELAASGELFTNIRVSFVRAAIGFLLGGGTGLVLGLITGLSRRGELALDTSVQMLRSIPSLAILPLVILWLGIDEGAKVFLVAFSTMFPMYLNTYHGIKSVDANLIEMAKTYGMKGRSLLRYVILPGAISSILVGMRYSLGIAWVVLIVAETIAAKSGIGYMASNAREFLQTDIIFLSIILYALLGKSTDWLARRLERRCLRWHASYQHR